jgi:hypothetical protein
MADLYATSIQYQGFTLATTTLYVLAAQFVATVLSIGYAVGDHKYGWGKKPVGRARAHFGSVGYHYRWMDTPEIWLPTYGWFICVFLVSVTAGLGMGFTEWIVSDYSPNTTSGNFWLTIVAFFIIIPVLAMLWAISLFQLQSIGWSLIFALLYFAAAGVQVGMTVAYVAMYQCEVTDTTAVNYNSHCTTSPYRTYQWLALFLGAALQFIWSCYVVAVAIKTYMKNRNRRMGNANAAEASQRYDLAPDESIDEHKAAITTLVKPLKTLNEEFTRSKDGVMIRAETLKNFKMGTRRREDMRV